MHVMAASKGSSILRRSPIPLGVPQHLLRVINLAISVPGRSAASDIYMISMPVTGATFTRVVSLPLWGVGTRIQVDVLVKKLRIDERKMRE